MTAFRLTLDLDEETRARWEAAAERIDYQRFEVWAHDTLDTAADPDAGQVVDLRARLTTAETELERAMTAAEKAIEVGNTASVGWLVEKDARAAAQARVEAADKHLLLAEQEATHGLTANAAFIDQCVKAARAALACPPQQRTKLDYGPYDPAGITELLIESVACPPPEEEK